MEAALVQLRALERNPVADESHYSELEYNVSHEMLENCYDLDGDQANQAWSWLFAHGYYTSPEGISIEDVEQAKKAIGITEDNE